MTAGLSGDLFGSWLANPTSVRKTEELGLVLTVKFSLESVKVKSRRKCSGARDWLD